MSIFSRRRTRSSQTVCSCCGKEIAGHFPALAFAAPAAWRRSLTGKPGCELTSDFCMVSNEAFFIRVTMELPIIDTTEALNWGIWVSLSEKNFKRYHMIFGTSHELEEEPYFGWFANQIPIYPDCLKIKTQVHLRGGGLRPEILLDHDNPHPLCQEQHTGITLERAHEIAKALL